MLKTIITPEDTHIKLNIPVEYVGKRREVTFLPLDENVLPKKSTMADFWGILSDETAAARRADIEKSRDEWERDI